MFQPLIDQARDMIQRLHASAEKGRDNVPSAVAMRYSEFEAWETAARGIVDLAFGHAPDAIERWYALADRRNTLMSEAMLKDVKRGEYYGMIDYFHLAIGLLLEFEAAYHHGASGPIPAAPAPGAGTRVEQLPPDAHEQVVQVPRPSPQASQPRVARTADDSWDVTISLGAATYNWLTEVATAREPAGVADGAAIARLAATIVERVATHTQRGGA